MEIVTNQGSLLYRCFKAKYFPRCSFLEAFDSHNSPYVWKSLIAAQPILKKGYCWRLGNGSSIARGWILNHPRNKFLFPLANEEWEWQVSDLIGWRVNQWDREWIEMVFHRFDTEAILKIPLSRRQVQDAVVWLHCKNGKYLVKLGYHTAWLLAREDNGGEESSV